MKFGLTICYDLFFPELYRIYALRGADAIINISASPSATQSFFEKLLVARAIENTTFIIYCNLVGTELNMVFWGGNQLIGPRGNIQTRGEDFKDCVVTGELDAKEIEVARTFRRTIRDTKFSLLHELAKVRNRQESMMLEPGNEDKK